MNKFTLLLKDKNLEIRYHEKIIPNIQNYYKVIGYSANFLFIAMMIIFGFQNDWSGVITNSLLCVACFLFNRFILKNLKFINYGFLFYGLTLLSIQIALYETRGFQMLNNHNLYLVGFLEGYIQISLFVGTNVLLKYIILILIIFQKLYYAFIYMGWSPMLFCIPLFLGNYSYTMYLQELDRRQFFLAQIKNDQYRFNFNTNIYSNLIESHININALFCRFRKNNLSFNLKFANTYAQQVSSNQNFYKNFKTFIRQVSIKNNSKQNLEQWMFFKLKEYEESNQSFFETECHVNHKDFKIKINIYDLLQKDFIIVFEQKDFQNQLKLIKLFRDNFYLLLQKNQNLLIKYMSPKCQNLHKFEGYKLQNLNLIYNFQYLFKNIKLDIIDRISIKEIIMRFEKIIKLMRNNRKIKIVNVCNIEFVNTNFRLLMHLLINQFQLLCEHSFYKQTILIRVSQENHPNITVNLFQQQYLQENIFHSF